MKRTQVQLDEATYKELKRRAFEEGVSLSAVVRALLREKLNATPMPRPLEIFQFIGSGQTKQGSLAPVSERHDEALAEILRNDLP